MGTIKGIFFDQDGVIIDTEKDGHRVAFNETFKAFGYPFSWDVDRYHKLLQIAGGKERMRHYFEEEGLLSDLSQDEMDALIKQMHKQKTEAFIGLIESQQLPLRPGTKRLMKEAMDSHITIGVCTTSNERSARAIANGMLKEIHLDFILAGDVVTRKKPDPEIYLLALQKTGLAPQECVVIEDSRNGVLAAKAAGLPVIATTNIYTEKEDLREADLVLTCLGDPNGEKGILKQGDALRLQFDGVLHMNQIMGYFAA